MFLFEQIHIFAKRGRLIPIADGIEACVRAKFFQAARVGAALRAKTALLGPTALRVKMAKINHQARRESIVVIRGGRMSGASSIKNCCSCVIGARICVTIIQSVIGKTASDRMESIVALLQRVEKIRERTD